MGRLRANGSPDTVAWATDPSGQHLARKEIAYHQVHIQVLADSKWRDIFHGEDDHDLSILGFSADFSSVFALGAINESRSRFWALPLDGSAPRVLLEDAERDVMSVEFDRFTGQPLGAFLSGSEHEEKWLNADAEARHKVLAHAFPGLIVRMRDGSRSGDRLLVEASSPSSPPVYYLVDKQTHKADIVAEGYPALANVKLGEVRAITYKARDGTEIPAYLTLPPGVAPQNLPLVVLPHGGPQARDYFEFDWWAQFLASRGYAVLKPQFRGSSGFGDTFEKAGHHQWGGLMQDDVSDGVAAMISQGLVDAKRVCIVGASYGGYAALAGAAFTPTLYKCAVSINGVSDLPEMLADYDRGTRGGIFDYWREHIGAPYDPAVRAKSPVHAADRISVPILLMHAANDTVVPLRQSEGMARALSKAGKSVTFIQLPGEDHWLSRGETRTQMLKVLEQFLAANL
jgi:dienelactone hydrolase